MLKSTLQRILFHALMGLLLVLCYPLQELYSGNQGVYFLWGMAKAGLGSLPHDPLLAQIDPYPLFSLLVYAVVKFLHPWVFHLLYWVLNSIYAYALFGIAHLLFDIYGRPKKTVLLSALFLLAHASAVWGGLFRIMFDMDLRQVWDSGIAEQGVLRGYLQPSTMGVFLVLSVYHFLKRQPQGVFLSLAVAALIHPNYMFLGTVMGVLFILLFITMERTDMMQTLVWAGVSVLAVMPQLLYVGLFFLPQSEQESTLMHEAVMQTQPGNIHLSPSLWLDTRTLIQLLTMLVAMWLFRKEKVGKLMMAFAAAFGLLSVLAFVADSQTLLSLTPWRISVVLMPVSTLLILSKLFLTERQVELHRRTLAALLVGSALVLSFVGYRIFGHADDGFISLWQWRTGLLLLMAGGLPLLPIRVLRHPILLYMTCVGTVVSTTASGILETHMEHRFQVQTPEAGIISYLKQNALSDDVVMLPLELSGVRINAEVAVVADKHLVHGLKLPQLLERQQTVSDFYAGRYSEDREMSLLQSGICSVLVLPMEKEIPTELCYSELYRDSNYRLVRL